MAQIAALVLLLLVGLVDSRLAGECAMICNDLRREVLTLDMCREAKRTLPRPKVGDFCSNAMEQGFSDACVALCMDQAPVQRVAQTCRSAAVEMPRPTVRKWCEHGYNVAFAKTREDLHSHFKTEEGTQDAAAAAATKEDTKTTHEEAQPETTTATTTTTTTTAEEVRETRAVLTTLPIELNDVKYDLALHEGEQVEDAVVVFCRLHVKDDVSSCIRKLLPEVLERVESEAGAAGLRGAAV